jgi:hypothetical protein
VFLFKFLRKYFSKDLTGSSENGCSDKFAKEYFFQKTIAEKLTGNPLKLITGCFTSILQLFLKRGVISSS